MTKETGSSKKRISKNSIILIHTDCPEHGKHVRGNSYFYGGTYIVLSVSGLSPSWALAVVRWSCPAMTAMPVGALPGAK